MNLLKLSVKLPVWADPLYEGLEDGLLKKYKDAWCAEAKNLDEKDRLLLYTSFIGLMGVPYELEVHSNAPPDSPLSSSWFLKAFLLDSSRSFSANWDLRSFDSSSTQSLKSTQPITELPPVGWQHKEKIRELSELLKPKSIKDFRIKNSLFLDHLIWVADYKPSILRIKDSWETSIPQWAVATVACDDVNKWVCFFDKCLSTGVDIFSKNKNGNTLAHGVVFNSRTEEQCNVLLKWCVDHGVDWASLNKAGNDALSLYKFNPRRDIAFSPYQKNMVDGEVYQVDWSEDAELWVSNWQKKILECHINKEYREVKSIEAL